MLHQIIYTSCRSGIKGSGDGLQIFSLDRSFPDNAMPDVEKMFSYTPPRISVPMTSELAKEMPQSFYYKFLGNDNYAWGLNTYLGLDYMGEGSRFGNFMSHVILSDERPKIYPAQYYASSMFRDKMEYEEVNSKEKPGYLDNPEEKLGTEINIDSVIKFLNENHRIDVYINMVAAMLDFRNSKKRVLILDEYENIIYWIAALEYAIPLSFAVRIPFSTYEYNPNSSPYRICGVLQEGTNYSNESDTSHYTFNLFKNTYPTFPINDFLSFIKNSLSLNDYGKLAGFHDFLVQCFEKYYLANDDIYDFFYLYNKETLSVEELNKIFTLTEKFANIAGLDFVINKVINILNRSDTNILAFLSIMDFLLVANEKKKLKLDNVLLPVYQSFIINIFGDNSVTFDEFKEYYAKMCNTSKAFNIKLGEELCKDSLFGALLKIAVTSNDVQRINWFYRFFDNWRKSSYFAQEKFFDNIIQLLEKHYESISNYNDKFETLTILNLYNAYPSITQKLIADLLEPIKFQKIQAEDLNRLMFIFNYVNGWQDYKYIEKFELMSLGLQFQNLKLDQNIELAEPIEIVTCENQSREFFDWIMPYAIQRYKKTEDMLQFYQMLIMNENVSNMFLCSLLDYIAIYSRPNDLQPVLEYMNFIVNINPVYSNELLDKIKKLIRKFKAMNKIEYFILSENSNDPTIKKNWLELKSKIEGNGILSIAKKWFFKK